MLIKKQLVLKPQDFLVSLKISASDNRPLTFAELGQELSMSASEVHSASERATVCRLLTKDNGQLRAINIALHEFILYGAKYVFPPIMGSLVRGIPTGAAGYPLREHFTQGEMLEFVWPDPSGNTRGISLLPIYPSVPIAASNDSKLYEMLVLVDAIRVGAAREREMATSKLAEYLL
ncbi:MAG: hypothetical protein WBP13_07580 [Methylophilaceae bacterium]